MEKKYRVLRVVATIYKVLAWILLVVSVLGGCGAIAFGVMAGGAGSSSNNALGPLLGGVVGGAISGLVAIFFGVIYFLFLYAFAELIDVALALESNTRATVEQLKTLQPKT
jgi:hypothetical protein